MYVIGWYVYICICIIYVGRCDVIDIIAADDISEFKSMKEIIFFFFLNLSMGNVLFLMFFLIILF